MTERLHNLIDSGAQQPAINERVAALMDSVTKDVSHIGSDHEKRIRFLERTISYGLGAIGMISAILYAISALKGHAG